MKIVTMRIAKFMLAGIALMVWGWPASAGVNEWVHSAAAGASSVATKAERGVKRGVEAGISGVERGTKAAGRGVETAARKVGIPAGPKPAQTTSPPGELAPAR
ncbi:MAG TPA: hypothetical protein VFZ28_15065 [Burkholderiaceae bacterium]|nr:hypothetical protein [Burkholderiaceae bacterium]